MAKPPWDRRLYGLVLGIVLALGVSALIAGPLGWDEETDYIGLRGQLGHALQLLRGGHPDYHAIHANLEYYGTVGLLPAWVLWFVQQGLVTGSFSLDRALFEPGVEHQLTGFFAVSHGVLLLELVLLSRVVVAIARRLSLRQPWLAGAVVLVTPSLLGHAFVNSKDGPFALFYSLYSLGLILRLREPLAGLSLRRPGRAALIALLGATLMVNQKMAALVPVLISEGVLALLRCWSPAPPDAPGGLEAAAAAWRRRFAVILPVLALPLLALTGALLLQPAAWGVPPQRFVAEAVQTFALHSWGGCMWFAGRCVGVRDPSWSAAAYMLHWLPAKLPLLLLVLPLLQGLAWLRQAMRRTRSPGHLGRATDPAAVLLLLQLLLLPGLAALRNANLYDADRHLLFVVPPLAVLAVMGFERLQELPAAFPAWRGPRPWALALVALLAVGLLLDDLLLHPYQLAYFNEIGRHSLNHRNTSVEYWSVSAKEAVQQALLRGRLPPNPTVADSLTTLPLFIGLRQLGGRVAAGASTELVFQVRNPPDFQAPPPADRLCARPIEVKRRQLFAPDLLMSRLFVCRNA